jgi:hypothetical protein
LGFSFYLVYCYIKLEGHTSIFWRNEKCLLFGVWCLVLGVWRLVFGVFHDKKLNPKFTAKK